MMTVNQIGSTPQDITWNNLSSVPRIIEDGSNCYIYGPHLFGYGPDLTEQISSSTNTPSYVISDYAGVGAITSANGSINSLYSYTPYGVKAGGGTISTPFGFQGGYDLATGLVSFIHRVYDPSTAQFLSVDPLYDETLQAYSFAGSDPMNGSDAEGDLAGVSFHCPNWTNLYPPEWSMIQPPICAFILNRQTTRDLYSFITYYFNSLSPNEQRFASFIFGAVICDGLGPEASLVCGLVLAFAGDGLMDALNSTQQNVNGQYSCLAMGDYWTAVTEWWVPWNWNPNLGFFDERGSVCTGSVQSS